MSFASSQLKKNYDVTDPLYKPSLKTDKRSVVIEFEKEPPESVPAVLRPYKLYMTLGPKNPKTGSALGTILITTSVYMDSTARKLSKKMLDDYETAISVDQWATFPKFTAEETLPAPGMNLKQLVLDAQDPVKVDAMAAIQKELDATKEVLHKTIESVLERGEKIDSLVAKSDSLTMQSKMFYTQAKKQNSCCIVM